MPIWIKHGNWLGLCSEFGIVPDIDEDFKEIGTYEIRMSTSPDIDRCGYVSVKDLTKQQAKDIMRCIVESIATESRYFEIPEQKSKTKD